MVDLRGECRQLGERRVAVLGEPAPRELAQFVRVAPAGRALRTEETMVDDHAGRGDLGRADLAACRAVPRQAPRDLPAGVAVAARDEHAAVAVVGGHRAEQAPELVELTADLARPAAEDPDPPRGKALGEHRVRLVVHHTPPSRGVGTRPNRVAAESSGHVPRPLSMKDRLLRVPPTGRDYAALRARCAYQARPRSW